MRKEAVKEAEEEEERCSSFTRVSVFFGGQKAQIEANGGGRRRSQSSGRMRGALHSLHSAYRTLCPAHSTSHRDPQYA